MATEPETWTADEVFAAVCIMHEIADPVLREAPRPWEAVQDTHGINELRRFVAERLAKPCNAAWDRAWERFEQTPDLHDDSCEAGGGTGVCTCNKTPDPGSFDADFVPVWLRECVDWSDPDAGPKVRGSYATA